MPLGDMESKSDRIVQACPHRSRVMNLGKSSVHQRTFKGWEDDVEEDEDVEDEAVEKM